MKKLLMIALFTGILLCAAGTISAETTGTEIGNKAPDFELMTMAGETVKLSDFEGQRIMLNFWATWCPPCREEMPDMQKFYEDKEAIVLAINLTDMERNKNQVTQFVGENGLTFPILMDELGKVSTLYRISPIPTTYMIDSKGIIRHKAYGAMNYERMIADYEKMD
ncbi:peroxiredoxin family protein [Oceanobacillus saliphilus]|uniref:peroxiredoxin family protein n=1 Tax=Oceanobacillus saliphilus TaxID=2925834 RepID=UPI00201DF139|nr:TlpA disulfide reductase family protein [Oceanobacillus saliphilus]